MPSNESNYRPAVHFFPQIHRHAILLQLFFPTNLSQKRRPRKPKVVTQTPQQENDESTAVAAIPKQSIVKRKRKSKSKPHSNDTPASAALHTAINVETSIEAKPIIVDVPKPQMKKQAEPLSSKDPVQAEREARRQAKLDAKHKQHDETRKLSPPQTAQNVAIKSADDKPAAAAETKSREQIIAEREQKKQAKLLKKKGITADEHIAAADVTAVEPIAAISIVKDGIENLKLAASELPSVAKIQPSKAERRAIQEAQRAAKAKLLTEKSVTGKPSSSKAVVGAKSDAPPHADSTAAVIIAKSPTIPKKSTNITTVKVPTHRVKLFNHLYADAGNEPEHLLNSNEIHPALVKLGAQYASRMVVGSNARCLAFMAAMKKVIQDYRTPSQKEFSRGLEENIQPGIAYLHQCRPLAVSVSNAIKFIKWQITQLAANETDTQLRERLLDAIDTYIRDQIEKAAQAISISVQEKISNDDVILTFGCSSLINHILEEAQSRKVNFRVVVVDARPDNEGRQQLERLVVAGIKCSFVLINAIGFIMPEVSVPNISFFVCNMHVMCPNFR